MLADKSFSENPHSANLRNVFNLLNIADAEPFAWQKVLGTTKGLSANLFLKHLMVLSDISGEKLMRFKKELPKIFNKGTMEFVWNAKNYSYKFQTLSGNKTWNNTHLKVDGVGLSTYQTLIPVIEDITHNNALPLFWLTL